MQLASRQSWQSRIVELFLLDLESVTDRYVSWLNDPAISRYLESRYVVHSLESTRSFVAGTLAHPDVLFLGIRHRALGQHVGNIKIEINRRHGLGEVGILIGEQAVHGQGVGTDAIATLAGIARDELGVRKLSAGCYASNKGSERAFVKAGFVVEGVRPQHFLLDGNSEALTLLGRVL